MKTSEHVSGLRKIWPVSDQCVDRLEIFVSRLREWQKKTNLVAPSTVDEIWSRHVADSLQCFALKPNTPNWLDIGSGGGFPGLVIAAAAADVENAQVTLIESLNKKTAFLRQANRQMGTNARVVTSRIEESYGLVEQPDIITARALAPLNVLFELCLPWLGNGAVGLFQKGREHSNEIQDCNGLWAFDLIHHDSIISPDSVILEIRNLERISG